MSSKPPGKKKTNWSRIRAEYEAGGCSLSELAKKYGLPLGTVKARAHRERWAAGAAEVASLVQPLVHEKLAEQVAQNVVDHLALVDQFIAKLQEHLQDAKPGPIDKMTGALIALLRFRKELAGEDAGEQTTGIQFEIVVAGERRVIRPDSATPDASGAQPDAPSP